MWSIGYQVLILRDYLGFMLLSAMNFIFLIFFLLDISIFIQLLNWMEKVQSLYYLGCLHSSSCTEGRGRAG